MSVFKSANSYWDFARSVKSEARYVYSDEVQSFLNTVVQTSESRRKKIPKGHVLTRAQRGSEPELRQEGEDEFYVDAAYGHERKKPKAEFVGDGRVNPRGIPCLYLADNEQTAMAEVRPWLGSYVSLAQFKVMRDCEIVDCSMDKKRGLFDRDIELEDPARMEAAVWGDIAEAFSRPLAVHEPHIEYVPTQVLAEAFRRRGYDGIVYKSLLNRGGLNIALFDLDAADLMNCALYETRSVSFDFDQIDNPYFRIEPPRVKTSTGRSRIVSG
jgi:RES domain-containing protein